MRVMFGLSFKGTTLGVQPRTPGQPKLANHSRSSLTKKHKNFRGLGFRGLGFRVVVSLLQLILVHSE